MEAQIVHVPLGARIDREMQSPPFAADESGLEAGAKIYTANCASCHGRPGNDVSYAQWMYPQAPQLWKKHKNGVVGVSDDETGETYWKVKNGIRLTGMPAYQHILSETEMWQVSLLLKNADKPLSPVVVAELAK
jgi:mono/diheme cytochrome c family protein